MPDVAAVERPKVEAMRIVTGCKTPEQFVSVFYRFCDAKTCFIPTSDTRPVGSVLAFSLRLADGTPMLRGTCHVKAAWNTKDNAFNRPGVQLAIETLSSESSIVFEQLLSQKTAVTEAPVVEPIDTTPTIQMPPLHREEKRVAGSAYVLPANPLSDVDDAGLEAFLGSKIAESDGAELDDDLAIPVAAVQQASREMKTLLGVAPLKVAAAPKPVRDTGTAPLVLATRPPALRTAMEPLQSAIAGDERFWYACALLAALFVVGLVALSAIVLR